MAWLLSLLTASALLLATPALASETTVLMRPISAAGTGDPIGNLLLRDTSGGLQIISRLSVRADGTSRQTLLAPRVTLAAIRGHAVIVHAGGDNYADQPAPLGGGGARVACGLIP